VNVVLHSISNKTHFLRFVFRLREELIRTNEQLKQYRNLIYLINEKALLRMNLTVCFVDDSKPIEKNFCLDDNTVVLYSKLPEEIQ